MIRSTDPIRGLAAAIAAQDAKRPQKRAESAQAVPKGMNKGEKRYAGRLELLRALGRIAAYYYEGARLKLAPNCTLTPDFMVIMPDKTTEFHEVKARKKNGGYWIEEDANVKIKLAPVVFPCFRFFIVWPGGDQCWHMKEIKP